MTSVKERLTTLPLEFQLPHPTDLADSPLEQEAKLQTRAIRIIRDLSARAENARDRLDDALSQVNNSSLLKVDSMISAGQLPVIPGVIKETVMSAQVLAEKTAEFAEKGLQLVKITVTPTGAGTNTTTLVYLDPNLTNLEEVKRHMVKAIEQSAQSTVQAKQQSYDSAKSDIEKFHKHYVSRMDQIIKMADLFKTAKTI